MMCSFIFIVLVCCQIWMCCHSRRDFRQSIAEDVVIRPSPIFVVPTAFATTTNYVVHVGSTIDGTANVAACSSLPVALSSCNLRSAWALCQSLITATTCPSSESPSTMLVTCAIVLPSMSTIQMHQAYGSNGLDLSGLATWATSCQYTQVSLSIASSTSSRLAIIAGDSSSAPLLNLQGISFVDLTMENVTITGFGDGSAAYPGVVLLKSIRSARFAHIQVGPKNVGFSSSVFSLQSLSSASIVHCTFVGNAMSFVYNLLAPYVFGVGGALQLINMNNVLISGCSFVDNYASFGSVGGALGIISSNNVAIVATSFVNNSVLMRYGWGGAVYIRSTTSVSISTSRFVSNSVSGGDGSGGALYVSFSSFINIVDSSFTNNTAMDAGGEGGALAIYHVSNTLIRRCTFIDNSAQQGGGVALGRNTMFDMIEVYARGNSAVQREATVLLLVNSGNGGFLAADNDNSYFSIVKSTFFENRAASSGGAFYFGSNNSFLAFTNLTFMKNVAVSGFGGAISMGSPNQYISFGGALPTLIFEPLEGPQFPFNVQGSTLARGGLRVVGYYAVFDASVVGTCDCLVQVGSYLVGAADPKCDLKKGWDANHMPGMNGAPPYYVNQTDIINNALNTANGRINVMLAPVVVATGPNGKDIKPTLSFVGNQAGAGGGAVYLSTQHRFVLFMDGTSFVNNAVTSSTGSGGGGGAIYIGSQNSNIYLFANTFQGGQGAAFGGAVAIRSNNFVINFYDCVFVSNTAQQGGAIYIYQNNGDTATKNGDHTITNGVQLSGGSIRNNNALLGGGIYMFWENVVLLQQMQLTGNVAGDRGGALFADMGFQSLYVNTVTFSDNHAGISGGAIASDVDNFGTSNAMNSLTLQGAMVFQRNSAGSLTGTSLHKGYGGALSITTSMLILAADTQLIVRNNTADGGSAILFVSTSASAVSMTTAGPGVSMLFADNVCRSEGGTVYWIRSSNHSKATAVGPLLQQTGNNTNGRTLVWTNNHAPLSPRIATQPTILRSFLSSTTVTLSQYGSFIRPSPSFQLVDSFGVVNSTDFASSVIATVISYNCGNGRIGYLSGIQNVRVEAGVATFDSLSAFCFPGGNMTLQFTAQLSGFESYHSLSATVTINFRSCLEGEILEVNQCTHCPSGSYSFSFNQATTCAPCPPNADDCSGAIISVSPGYWRPSVYSKVFLKCPFPTGCIGGNGSRMDSNTITNQRVAMRHLTDVGRDNAECAEGYEGPLCGVCSSGYFLNVGMKECQTCRENGPSQIATLVLIPFFLLICAWGMIFAKNDKNILSYLPMTAAAASTSSRPGVNEESEETTSMITSIVRMFSSLSFDIVIPKFKIVVTSFQILSTFPESLSLSLSHSPSQVLRSLSYFVNLLAVPGSPQCYAARFDYIDRLMLHTVAPLVICALLPLIFGVHFTYLKRRGKDFRPIVSHYVSMFLLITYTVLPSVCTTIFGTFSPCLDIDPEGLSGTHSLMYLPKDLSISCNSSRYYYGIGWASVMLVIYPVGIPSLYLYLLFLARAEIIRGKEKRITTSASKTLKGSGKVLSNSIHGRDSLENSINGRSPLDNSVYGRETHMTLTNSGNGRGLLSNSVNRRGSFSNSVNDTNHRLLLESTPVVEQSTEAVKTPSTAAKKPKDNRSKAEKLLGKVTSTANKKAEKLLGTVILVANNHAAKILSEEGILKYIVSELEFLHRDYRASHWYWEIVLTYGKLLMTAVISIIYPGSNDQILIAWIFAFLLMRVQTMASPYLDHYDDSLKKIADYQILLFLFIAIIKQGNVVSGVTWATFINVIMFFLIFSTPVAAFWYAFIAPSETVASLRKVYREQKAKALLQRQSHALQDAMSSGNLSKRGPVQRSSRNNNSNASQRSNDISRKSDDNQRSQRDPNIFSRKIHTDQKTDQEIDKIFDVIENSGGGVGTAQKGDTNNDGNVDEKSSEENSVSILVTSFNSSKKEPTFARSSVKSSESGMSDLQTSQLSTKTTSQQQSGSEGMSQQHSSSLSFPAHIGDLPPSLSNRPKHKEFVGGGFGPDNDDDSDESPLPSATPSTPSPPPWLHHKLTPLTHTEAS